MDLITEKARIEIGKFLLASQNILKHDIALVSAAHLFVPCSLSTLFQQLDSAIEIEMRLENHTGIGETAFAKEFGGSHPIQHDAIGNHWSDMTFGKILEQKREVVAEIQISLAR